MRDVPIIRSTIAVVGREDGNANPCSGCKQNSELCPIASTHQDPLFPAQIASIIVTWSLYFENCQIIRMVPGSMLLLHCTPAQRFGNGRRFRLIRNWEIML